MHKPMDQIILFGDSITQQSFNQDDGFGAGAALSNLYVRQLDVVNRGLSGYNTEQALVALPKVIPPPEQGNIRLLTIFFGANDARLPNTAGGTQQHVPLEQYTENIKALATHPCLKAHKDLRVVLVTPAPVDERKLVENDEENYPELGRNPPPRRTAEAASLYAQAVRDVGRDIGIAVLDLWTAMMSRAGYDGSKPLAGSKDAPRNEVLREYLHDGLHFSGTGYKVLYEELVRLIGKNWPELLPERLTFALPRWDDVDAWKAEGIELASSA